MLILHYIKSKTDTIQSSHAPRSSRKVFAENPTPSTFNVAGMSDMEKTVKVSKEERLIVCAFIISHFLSTRLYTRNLTSKDTVREREKLSHDDERKTEKRAWNEQHDDEMRSTMFELNSKYIVAEEREREHGKANNLKFFPKRDWINWLSWIFHCSRKTLFVDCEYFCSPSCLCVSQC